MKKRGMLLLVLVVFLSISYVSAAQSFTKNLYPKMEAVTTGETNKQIWVPGAGIEAGYYNCEVRWKGWTNGVYTEHLGSHGYWGEWINVIFGGVTKRFPDLYGQLHGWPAQEACSCSSGYSYCKWHDQTITFENVYLTGGGFNINTYATDSQCVNHVQLKCTPVCTSNCGTDPYYCGDDGCGTSCEAIRACPLTHPFCDNNWCHNCRTNADCAGDQICCTDAPPSGIKWCANCCLDSDCPGDEVCENSECVNPICDPPCGDDEVCDPDTATCVGCLSDNNCDACHVCDLDSSSSTYKTCLVESDAEDGNKCDDSCTLCSNGVCENRIDCDGTECGTGEACVSGACEVVPEDDESHICVGKICGDGIVQTPNDAGINEECDGEDGCIGCDWPDVCLDNGESWTTDNSATPPNPTIEETNSNICTSLTWNGVNPCCPAGYSCDLVGNQGCLQVSPDCEDYCAEITDRDGKCLNPEYIHGCGIIPKEHLRVFATVGNNCGDDAGIFRIECSTSCLWGDNDGDTATPDECYFNVESVYPPICETPPCNDPNDPPGTGYVCSFVMGQPGECVGGTRQIRTTAVLKDSSGNIVNDPGILQQYPDCTDITTNYLCSFGTRLSFFSWVNLVIALAIIVVIYYLIKNRKVKKKKVSGKKRK